MGVGIPVDVVLIPVGDVPWEPMERLKEELERRFRSCSIGDPIPIPPGSYNPRRRQYLSTAILRSLLQLSPPEGGRVLGVADVDLYAPRLNFVFGEAQLGGRCAVISLVRLRQEFYGLPPDEELFRQRAVKEAMHELGHTLGLRHCLNSGCVMFFSNSLMDTDRKSADLCPRCLNILLRSMRVGP